MSRITLSRRHLDTFKTEIIGYFAAFCTTFAFLPQAIKTLQTKDTRGISLSMYVIFTLGVFLWLVYGIFIMNYPVIIANAITFTLAATILVFKLRYG